MRQKKAEVKCQHGLNKSKKNFSSDALKMLTGKT
jgi:hypothetical protein